MNTRQLLALIALATVYLSLSKEVSCAIWRGKRSPPGGEKDNVEDEAAPEDIEKSEGEEEDVGEAGSGRGRFKGYKNRVGMKLDFIESLPTGLKGKGGSRMATLVGSGKEEGEDSEEADEEDDDDQLHGGGRPTDRAGNKLKFAGKPKVPKGAEDANEEYEDVKIPGKKGIKAANRTDSDLMGNFNIPGTKAANTILPNLMGKTKVEEIDNAEVPEEETDDEDPNDVLDIPLKNTDVGNDKNPKVRDEPDNKALGKQRTKEGNEIEPNLMGNIKVREEIPGPNKYFNIPGTRAKGTKAVNKILPNLMGKTKVEEIDDAGEIPEEETDDADPNDVLDIPVKNTDVGNEKNPKVRDEPDNKALGKQGAKDGNEIEPNLMGKINKKVKLSPDGVEGSNGGSDIPVETDSEVGNESSPDEVPDNENSDTLNTKYPKSNEDSKKASTKPNLDRGPINGKIKSEDEEDEEDAENADPMAMLQRYSPAGKYLGPPSHLKKKMKKLIVVLTMEYESLMKVLYPNPLKHPPPRKYLLWDKIKFRKPLFLKKISSPYGRRLSKL